MSIRRGALLRGTVDPDVARIKIGGERPEFSSASQTKLGDENPTAPIATAGVMASCATQLRCAYTGEIHAADVLHNLSRAGKPLLVEYDLARAARTLTREALASRPMTMWRYKELLPIRDEANIISLGEVVHPLVDLPAIAREHGCRGRVIVKDESRLPTGSFKARGLAMAVSKAKELGVRRMAMPTNGNAGAALAAYSRRAGIEAFAFCPNDTPDVNVREIGLQGARVFRVNGLIDECGKIVAEGRAQGKWFDVSTLKEPYRIEGKKTMGMELAEQLDWRLPDVILCGRGRGTAERCSKRVAKASLTLSHRARCSYPTGGGTGLIGMHKAFKELKAVGLIKADAKVPRMVAVQAAGCAPIVRAFEQGERHATRWEGASTIAYGIRVPQAVGDFLILDAVRESGGFAIAVDDEAIQEAQRHVCLTEGLLLCPEGAATYAALRAARADGRIGAEETCVLFNCATGLKYDMPPVTAAIDKGEPIDWNVIEG